MGQFIHNDVAVEYQWASDIAFDGIRLEILSDAGAVLFDVSVPDAGSITVNTFGQEIPASLVNTAVEVARQKAVGNR